jgi:hypothetical protein
MARGVLPLKDDDIAPPTQLSFENLLVNASPAYPNRCYPIRGDSIRRALPAVLWVAAAMPHTPVNRDHVYTLSIDKSLPLQTHFLLSAGSDLAA